MKSLTPLSWVVTFLLTLCPPLLSADSTEVEVPFLSGPLVDEGSFLAEADASKVSGLLKVLNQSKKVQMAILIPKTLQGFEIESYSIAVVEKWQLGKKGSDNGLLLVVAPKERKLRFEVGYGLEGVLTDAKCNQIIQNLMVPYLRANQFGDGLLVAIEAVATELKVALTVPISKRIEPRKRSGQAVANIFFFFLFLLLILLSLFGRGGYRRGWGGRYGGGGFGGGGHFGGGGFGGGGSFGGGGGGFGGGGASGNW